MINKVTLVVLFLVFCKQVVAQKTYNSFTISKELKENANAVVRLSETNITVTAIDQMRVNKRRIVTVLNEKGKRHAETNLYYDNSRGIKKLSAIVYDRFGKEIKKFKKSDFKDESAISGGTMYSDSRVKYLKYIPQKYPYTIEFVSEYIVSTTAFVPEWIPVHGYNVSIEKSIYTFTSPTIPFRFKEYNAKDWITTSIEKNNENLVCSINNQKAIKYEYLAPNFTQLMPYVKIILNEFNLYGIKGGANNWSDFGKWQYDNLLKGRDVLDEKTLLKISNLTKNKNTSLEKAKAIYKYVQDNTRYISVQLGIGGLQPEMATDVDRLKYGDCKGLTNYTKALLESQGIASYYAEVYSGEDKKSFDKSFTSFEGNHIILCLPQKDEAMWLECTSQSIPFGFLGNFTDDRDVLVMKPTGGEIHHTTRYTEKENTQITTAQVNISSTGVIDAKLHLASKGLQYDNLRGLDNLTIEKQKKYYFDKWDYLNGLSLEELKVINDTDAVLFKENITLSSKNSILKINGKLVVPLNLFNRWKSLPTKYAARKLPFQISRSFTDIDSCVFKLPKTHEVEFLPKNIKINTEFGYYELNIKIINKNEIECVRAFSLREGEYANKKYLLYRNFIKKIIKKDKLKLILKQIAQN